MFAEVLNVITECRRKSMTLHSCNDLFVPVITRALEAMQTALQDNANQLFIERAIDSLDNERKLSQQYDTNVNDARDVMYGFFMSFHDFLKLLLKHGCLPIPDRSLLAIDGPSQNIPFVTFPFSVAPTTVNQTGAIPMSVDPTTVDQTGRMHFPNRPIAVDLTGVLLLPRPSNTVDQSGAVPVPVHPTTVGGKARGGVSSSASTAFRKARAIPRTVASSAIRKTRTVPSSVASNAAGSSRSHSHRTASRAPRSFRPMGASTPIRSQTPSFPRNNMYHEDSNFDYSADQEQSDRCEIIVEEPEDSIMVIVEGTEMDGNIQPTSNQLSRDAVRIVDRKSDDARDEQANNSVIYMEENDMMEGAEESPPPISPKSSKKKKRKTGEILGRLSSMASFEEERAQENSERNLEIDNNDNDVGADSVKKAAVDNAINRAKFVDGGENVMQPRAEENMIADPREEVETEEEPTGSLKCSLCAEFATDNINSYIGHLRTKHKTTVTKEGLLFRCECGHECRSASHFKGQCLNSKITIASDIDDEMEAGEFEENEKERGNMDEEKRKEHNEEGSTQTAAIPLRRVSHRGTIDRPKGTLKAPKKERNEGRDSMKMNTFQCIKCEFTSSSASYYLIHLRRQHKTTMKKSGFYFGCECGHKSRSGAHSRTCPNKVSIVNEDNEPFTTACDGPFIDVED